MDYKQLLSLVDLLRGERHEQRDSVLLAAVLLTWDRLSQAQRIPAELMLTPDLVTSPRQAEKVLLELADKLSVAAFIEATKTLQNTSPRTASELLEATLRLEQLGASDSYDPSDIAATMGGMRRGGLPFLPAEVCDLMISLALTGASDDASIYLPWAESGQLLGRCLKAGRSVAMESQGMDGQNLSELIRVHFEYPTQSQLVWSDPIKAPHFHDKGTLRKFDITIATPPFSGRVNSGDSASDSFNRFPEQTNSMTVLAIRHVLAQTKGRAVIAVSNSVLFSSGGERRLRKDLLTEGTLQSVIALPAGLLSDSNIPFSIVVLDNSRRHDVVRFVNCDSEHFKEEESRTRFKLKSIWEIVELALQRVDSQYAADENGKNLDHNDYNLLPSRYVMDADSSRVDKVMEQYETMPLEDVAEIIRPLPDTENTNPIEVLEVGAADILATGYIPQPSKKTSVSNDHNRSSDPFLQPYDIVMVIKGSVGKVSIAPLDTPPSGPGGWIVGQSMAIIRLQKPPCDPMSLVTFLRSDIGQELIRRIGAGATIPFLQIRELRQLRVPLLTAAQAAEARGVLQEQHTLRLELMRIQQQLDTTQVHAWRNDGPHPDPGIHA